MNEVEVTDPGAQASDDIEEGPERRIFTVKPAMHGRRLDRVLAEEVSAFSRTYLQKLIQSGDLVLDGRVCTMASRKLVLGQSVAIQLRLPPEMTAYRPQSIALNVLYEDDEILVINKPPGLVMHPAAGHWSGTVLNALLAHHRGASVLPRAGIVHRLDKDTSGVFVVGKTLTSTQALSLAIAAREVQRTYWAIAHGRWTSSSPLTIDRPIGRDPRSKVRMAVVASGRPSRTDVELLGESVHNGMPLARVHCQLHTGRTHQIRVHLASQGHPLVADSLYGGQPAVGMVRQALHARTLRLQHPASGQSLEFDVNPPADFELAWNLLQTSTQTPSL